MSEIPPFNPFFSDTFKSYILTARITGSISTVCSFLMAFDLVRFRKQRLGGKDNMTNKILLAMSLNDILYSIGSWVINTVPAPEGIAFGAHGNVGTCTGQGFILQIVHNNAISFNISLSICYVLMVRYNWNGERLKKLTHAFLTFPILISIGTAVPPLLDDSYNFNVYNCYITAHPFGCGGPNAPPCERGFNSEKFILMNVIIAFAGLIINFVSMFLLYLYVLGKERQSSRFNFRGSITSSEVYKYSRKVAVQGIFYFLAFLLTWWGFYTFFIIKIVINPPVMPEWLNYCVVSFIPLQGFFNSIVYFRPKYSAMRNRTTTVPATQNTTNHGSSQFYSAQGSSQFIAAQGSSQFIQKEDQSSRPRDDNSLKRISEKASEDEEDIVDEGGAQHKQYHSARVDMSGRVV
jgi:hypothetical protein